MKRILLTGGTGFVGACLARRLLAEGHEVHLLVRPGYRPWRLAGIRDAVALHEAPMADMEAMRRLMASVRPHWVFHLAAHGAYSWETDAFRIAQTNVLGTVCLLEAALDAGCEAFVHAGSSSEYGLKDHAPSEYEWLDPNSAYAATKAAATLYCRHAALARQARVVTLRLYSVFGPYEDPNRLVPKLITNGLRGEWPPLADPNVARDFVYVDDVADAFLAAATTPGAVPGAVYNVGTGKQTTIGEAVVLVRHLLDIAAEPRWGGMAPRSWDTTIWVADPARIRRELGWAPRHSFEEGMRQTIRWFRENPEAAAHYSQEPT